MRCRGRLLNRRSLTKRISELGAGTLIIDQPLIGSCYMNAWWTPNLVHKVSPIEPTSESVYDDAFEKHICPEWDKWCWAEYQNPVDGTAFLISDWKRLRIEQWVTSTHPDVAIVNSISGLMKLEKRRAG